MKKMDEGGAEGKGKERRDGEEGKKRRRRRGGEGEEEKEKSTYWRMFLRGVSEPEHTLGGRTYQPRQCYKGWKCTSSHKLQRRQTKY